MGLAYASIRASDLKKSEEFYKRLGMKVIGRREPIPGELVVSLESKDTGQKLQLMWYGKNCRMYKPYEKGDEMDHLMFTVKDAKKEYNKMVKAGADVAMPLFETKTGKMIGFVKDPDGIWIGLVSD